MREYGLKNELKLALRTGRSVRDVDFPLRAYADETDLDGPAAFAITRITLATEGRGPGIDQAAFLKAAAEAKAGCPVSKALAGMDIQLEARLVG